MNLALGAVLSLVGGIALAALAIIGGVSLVTPDANPASASDQVVRYDVR